MTMRLDWKYSVGGDTSTVRDAETARLISDVIRVPARGAVATVYPIKSPLMTTPADAREWCEAVLALAPLAADALQPETRANVKRANSGEVYVSGPATDQHNRPIEYMIVPITRDNAKTFLAAILAALDGE